MLLKNIFNFFQNDPLQINTPNLDEIGVKSMFLKAYNEMIMSKDVLVSNLMDAVSKALDTSSLDKKIEELTNKLNEMNKEFELLVKMNTTTQQDIQFQSRKSDSA